MIAPRFALVACMSLVIGGCSVFDVPNLSNKELVAVGAIVYYTKDGFRWEVEDRRIAPDTYRIIVRQGKLKGSGQGEAEPIFKRRAEEIAAVQGCAGYTVLEYKQGLESDFLGVAQRVSEGLIRCNPPSGPSQPRT
jgi:hypothetical protein